MFFRLRIFGLRQNEFCDQRMLRIEAWPGRTEVSKALDQQASAREKQQGQGDLGDYEQRYRVVSNKLVAGRPLLHIYSEQPPGDGFAPSSPDLEDVFLQLTGDHELGGGS